MQKRARKAFNALKKMGCPVKEWDGNDRGHFWINAEEENAGEWLDYYNLFEGSKKLNEILNSNGLYFEWTNSAFGCVYDI